MKVVFVLESRDKQNCQKLRNCSNDALSLLLISSFDKSFSLDKFLIINNINYLSNTLMNSLCYKKEHLVKRSWQSSHTHKS